MALTVTFGELVDRIHGIDAVPPRAARALAAALAIEAGSVPREERLPPWLLSDLQGEELRAALTKWRRAERRAWNAAAPALRRLLRFLPPEEACERAAIHPQRRSRRMLGSVDPWTLGRCVRALLRHHQVLGRQEPASSVTVGLANLPRDRLSLAQRMRLQWVWLLRAYGFPIRSSDHHAGALRVTRALLRAFGLVRQPRGAWGRRTRRSDAGAEGVAEEEAERRQYRRAVRLLKESTCVVRESDSVFELAALELSSRPANTTGDTAGAAHDRKPVKAGSFTFAPARPKAAVLGKAISHLSSYVEEWEAIAQDPGIERLRIELPRPPAAGG